MASPKADQRPRAATESWDRSSDSDSDSDSLIMKTTKRRREVNYGPTIPRNPMFRSHTTPAAFFTQDTRPPPATIPALESNRHSSETDATVEEKPFNSVDFLEQISVFPGRPTGESHPFPEVEKVPNDPDIREAYEQVRSTLVGFWYSHVRAKQEDDVRREKEREEQEGTAEQKKPKDSEKWLPSFPQLKSSPSRPQLKAKPSLFEKLLHPGAMKTEESLNMCNQDDDSQSVSEKSDVTVVHIGPAPKSKKSYKDLHLQALKPKSYKDLQVLKSSSCKDLTQKTQITKSETTNRRPSSHARTSAREALAITQVVLRQLQADIIPPPLITRPTSDPEPGSHSKSKNKLKAKEKDKDKDASKSSKDKDKRKSLTKPIPQTLEAYMLRLPEVYDSHSAAIAADERECWKTYTIHSMSQLCYRGYWHIRLSPRDWIDPDFVADPDEYKFETILERQVAGLKVLRERRKGGDGRILKAALRVVWATKMVEVMERLCAGLEGKGRSEGVVEENSKDRTSEDGTANVLHSVVSNDTDAQTSITTRSHTYIPDRDQDFTHKSTAKDAVDANSDTNTIIHHDPNKENQPSSSPNTRLPYDIYIRAIRSQPGSAPQPPTTPRFPREQLHAAYKRVAERLAPGALPPEGHPAFRAEGVPLKGSSIQTSLPQVSMPNVSMMKRQRPAVPTSMARVAEVKRPALQTSVSDPLALQKTMTIGEVEKGTGLQGEGLKVPRLRPLRQVHAPGKEGAEDGDDEDDDEKGANARTRKMRWRKTTFNMGLVYGGDASDEE